MGCDSSYILNLTVLGIINYLGGSGCNAWMWVRVYLQAYSMNCVDIKKGCVVGKVSSITSPYQYGSVRAEKN